ncbi:hypothetical protein [Amycolatopsis japonica]|uniref:hypothetical protein n=1 Tax=Amycolatopsis japonica TaxID=208439 RepID=UPI00381DF004
MSGARLVLTLPLELGRCGGGIGAAALCGGGGQGDALIIEVSSRDILLFGLDDAFALVSAISRHACGRPRAAWHVVRWLRWRPGQV